jgi:predicted DNA-binding transcriptional regulator AlpA
MAMRLLKVKDIAEWCQVSIKTVYQWCALEQIPHIKINGAIRFEEKEFNEWLKSCKKEPGSGYNS